MTREFAGTAQYRQPNHDLQKIASAATAMSAGSRMAVVEYEFKNPLGGAESRSMSSFALAARCRSAERYRKKDTDRGTEALAQPAHLRVLTSAQTLRIARANGFVTLWAWRSIHFVIFSPNSKPLVS